MLKTQGKPVKDPTIPKEDQTCTVDLGKCLQWERMTMSLLRLKQALKLGSHQERVRYRKERGAQITDDRGLS